MFQHGRVNDSRSDGPDPHPVLGQFQRPCASAGIEAGLGRRVIGLPRIAVVRDGGNIDHYTLLDALSQRLADDFARHQVRTR